MLVSSTQEPPGEHFHHSSRRYRNNSPPWDSAPSDRNGRADDFDDGDDDDESSVGGSSGMSGFSDDGSSSSGSSISISVREIFVERDRDRGGGGDDDQSAPSGPPRRRVPPASDAGHASYEDIIGAASHSALTGALAGGGVTMMAGGDGVGHGSSSGAGMDCCIVDFPRSSSSEGGTVPEREPAGDPSRSVFEAVAAALGTDWAKGGQAASAAATAAASATTTSRHSSRRAKSFDLDGWAEGAMMAKELSIELSSREVARDASLSVSTAATVARAANRLRGRYGGRKSPTDDKKTHGRSKSLDLDGWADPDDEAQEAAVGGDASRSLASGMATAATVARAAGKLRRYSRKSRPPSDVETQQNTTDRRRSSSTKVIRSKSIFDLFDGTSNYLREVQKAEQEGMLEPARGADDEEFHASGLLWDESYRGEDFGRKEEEEEEGEASNPSPMHPCEYQMNLKGDDGGRVSVGAAAEEDVGHGDDDHDSPSRSDTSLLRRRSKSVDAFPSRRRRRTRSSLASLDSADCPLPLGSTSDGSAQHGVTGVGGGNGDTTTNGGPRNGRRSRRTSTRLSALRRSASLDGDHLDRLVDVDGCDDDVRSVGSAGGLQDLLDRLDQESVDDAFGVAIVAGGGGDWAKNDSGDDDYDCGRSDGGGTFFSMDLEDELAPLQGEREGGCVTSQQQQSRRRSYRSRRRSYNNSRTRGSEQSGGESSGLDDDSAAADLQEGVRRASSVSSFHSALSLLDVKGDLQNELLDGEGAGVVGGSAAAGEPVDNHSSARSLASIFGMSRKSGEAAGPSASAAHNPFDLSQELDNSAPSFATPNPFDFAEEIREVPSSARSSNEVVPRTKNGTGEDSSKTLLMSSSVRAIMNRLPSLDDEVAACSATAAAVRLPKDSTEESAERVLPLAAMESHMGQKEISIKQMAWEKTEKSQSTLGLAFQNIMKGLGAEGDT